MTELRILASLRRPQADCAWSVLSPTGVTRDGAGPWTGLPQRADRVTLVVPADEVLLKRTRLPPGAARRAGQALSFAVEDEVLGEPEGHLVVHVGRRDEQDVLAVFDRAGVAQWRERLSAAGAVALKSEILMLPWAHGQWSLAWDGTQGFVRTGEFEGAAVDTGSRLSPPLWLRQALRGGEYPAPASIKVFGVTPEAMPDGAAWARALGVPVDSAGVWDWRTAPAGDAPTLLRLGSRWRPLMGSAGRLKTAVWIAAFAVVLHCLLSLADWARLAREQAALRRAQEVRFRAVFPDALAVVDPLLQMRRKLTEARHAAGQPDSGDFRPLLEAAARALGGLPAGSLRSIGFDNGRLSLELAGVEQAAVAQLAARLAQSGFVVDPPPAAVAATAARTVFLSLRMP